MGFFKKIFKPVQKVVKKIVPKELRPALPFIAAYFGGPLLAGKLGTSGIMANAAFRNALAKGIVSGATTAATDPEGNVLRSALLAATPDVLSEGLGQFAKTGEAAKLTAGDPGFFKQSLQQAAAKGAGMIDEAGILKTVGAQTAIDQTAKLADIQEKELRDYEAKLAEQGIRDKAARRSAIFKIYTGAGYDSDYVNSVLDKYGYADGGKVMMASMDENEKEFERLVDDLMERGFGLQEAIDEAKRVLEEKSMADGGRVKYAMGGDYEGAAYGTKSGIEYLMEDMNDDKEKLSLEEIIEIMQKPKEDEIDVDSYLSTAKKGLEMLTPKQKPLPMMRFKEGGLMDLGGKEMDMRGGGFIPIGAKERADDVPARLSKNEFVMTADAVRAAGGGSVNKGAKRMYDLMHSLEARA